MPIILEEPEVQITRCKIEKFEAENSISLPEDFIIFYLVNNGGYLPESHEPNKLLLGGFFSFTFGKMPIEKRYIELQEDWPDMKGMIPFTYDDGGNLFLISANLENRGNVMLLLTDENEKVPVAKSFSEFLNMLL